ncbi:hypothetical protein [Gloeothece verrucosa]|uniref:Uncharacterized protein n=1 Tax=Gloeothece verrucosa (strain PCC 7822) TaxID=497965 RepID=E0UEK9_GLOV7|nr:hypothetical protein [Gloeothece verrucosa]ADN16577.1 conserved hypothetical protein [Gloeothece verrucosa PCC 7822]
MNGEGFDHDQSILLNKLEFEAAKTNEEVYGKYKGVYLYIKLGTEEEYKENPKDDPKTEYKFFRGCTIEYSETEEQAEQGIYQYKDTNVNIKLYW